jgi:hypothetical protein
MKPILPAILSAALLASPAFGQPQHRLVLTGVGRFAVLADLSTISRDGDRARMRSLQVTEEDFRAGGQTYWGGWSWWAFDCAARTADRLPRPPAGTRRSCWPSPAIRPPRARPTPTIWPTPYASDGRRWPPHNPALNVNSRGFSDSHTAAFWS